MAPIESHHIIIDGKYWNLEFDTKLHTIVFNRSESHLAPHFTDKYIGAACLWEGSKEEGECRTYLFPKNEIHNWVNEIIVANNKFNKVMNLDEYSEPVTRQVSIMRPDYYSFVISGDNYNLIPEVELAIGSNKRFNRMVFTFQMMTTVLDSIVAAFKWEDPIDSSYFDHNRDMIGISKQYSDQNKDYGYLILTKEGDQVYWCWQWIKDHNVS